MVSSYVQLLARRYKGKLDTDAEDFIAFAVDGVNRMQRLINDLLAYSRVTTRGKQPAPTDCEVVLEQVLRNLQIAIEESGATGIGTMPALSACRRTSSGSRPDASATLQSVRRCFHDARSSLVAGSSVSRGGRRKSGISDTSVRGSPPKLRIVSMEEGRNSAAVFSSPRSRK